MDPRAQSRIFFISIILISVVALGMMFAGSSAAETADHTVTGDDDDDGFSSIQEAINEADDGDVIEIEPGTYSESVEINKSVDIIAPNGATIQPPDTNNDYAILVRDDADPVLKDISVEGGLHGINSQETNSNWTATNVSIKDSTYGVFVDQEPGDWHLNDSEITNTVVAIYAYGTTGSWSVENTVIADNDDGIYAEDTKGKWNIEESVFTDTTYKATIADNSNPAGNTSYNYWGAEDGPSGEFDGSGEALVGNVTLDSFYEDEERTELGETDDSDSDADAEFVVVNATDGEGDYNTIQDAVDNASDGTEISIEPATYEEAVTIDRNITLSAGDDTIVQHTGSGAAVEIINSSTPTIWGGEITAPDGAAIDATSAGDGWSVEFVAVESADSGIQIDSNGTVESTFFENTETAVNASGSTGSWQVNDSLILDSETGVLAAESSGDWQVRETQLSDNTVGLDATDAAVRGDATHNFWGARHGPGGAFNGSGDPATGNVSISPLYADRNQTELIDEPPLFSNGAIESDPIMSGTTVTAIDGTQTTARVPAIRPANASFLKVSEDRSFRITQPEIRESVTVTPENDSTFNATTVDFWIYDSTGELDSQPELALWDQNNTRTMINASVTGDEGTFNVTDFDNDVFLGYQIEHLNETDTVIGEAEESIYGIGYEGSLEQNATEGTVEVTLDRDEFVDESWAVEYRIFNESELLLEESVNNTDDSETFAATFDADELDNGTYNHEFEIAPSADTDETILTVPADELNIGPDALVSEPMVNTSASRITPNTTAVNVTQAYDVDVLVDEMPYTDGEGSVVVTAGELNDTLAINYTEENIADGTLSVNETVTETAPNEPQTIPLNVTDLWVEDTEELLISDADITVDEIEVTEPTIDTDASSVTPTSTATEETQSYDIELTIDNTSLDDDSGEVDVVLEGFDSFEMDDGGEVSDSDSDDAEYTISYTADNVSDGTLTVSESVSATAPDSTGVYNVTVTDIRKTTDDSRESLIEDSTIPFSSISVDPPTTGTLVVNQTDGVGDYNSISDATDNAEDGATVLVEEGTYRESVLIDDNISLVGDQRGVVLDGSAEDDLAADGSTEDDLAETDSGAIMINESVDEAVIDGFTITGYVAGVGAGGSETDWELRNTTIQETFLGVSVLETNSNWSIEHTDISGAEFAGVLAIESHGDWRIEHTAVSDVEGAGIFTLGSQGDGTVTSTTVTNTSGAIAIGFQSGDSDTVVTNSTLTDSETGIGLVNAGGSVSILDSVVESNEVGIGRMDTDNDTHNDDDDFGLIDDDWTFEKSQSEWTVEESLIQGNEEGINATNAIVEGNATHNFWGAPDGPDAEFTGSGDPALGNLTADPYYINESLSTLGTTTELSLDTNETEVVAGDPIEFTVTDDDGDGVENATVELSAVANQTDADGTVTLRPETVGSLTARASNDDKLTDDVLTTYISDSEDIRVREPTLDVVESAHDFDAVDVGTTDNMSVTLRNDAPVNLSTDSLELDGADAYRLGDLPEEIENDSDEPVTVTFAPDDIGPTEAELEVDDEKVEFDGTGLAPMPNITSPVPPEVTAEDISSENTTLEISNDGNAPLNASLSVADDEDRFTVPETINISEGASESVEIEFDPNEGDNGTISPELTIKPEHPALETVEIPIVGTVTERSVDIRSEAVDFGNTTVGENDTTAVIVDNTGTTTEDLSVETDDESNFTIDSEDASFELEPGESERITPTANLSDLGEATAELRVENVTGTDINDTATLTATGQQPVLALSETDLTFDAPVNSTSSEEIEIANDGEAELRVDLDDAFNSTERENFSVGGSTGVVVPGDESHTTTVRFRPQAVANVTANLTVETNAGTENVSLDGEGMETELEIADDIPAFGAVGTDNSSTETLTIENNGGTELTDLSAEASPESEFEVVSMPDSLEAGQNGSVTVEFSPDAAGDRSGELEITAQNGTEESTVSTSLDGEGRTGELSVSRSELRTGVTTGGDSTTGSMTVENSEIEGTTLEIDEIDIEDDDTFSLDSSGLTEGDELGGTESGDLAVTFSPDEDAEDGEQTTELRLNATSGGETISESVTVSGVVTAPEPVISDDSLAFGTIDAGDESTETLTVSNDGGESFTIEGISTDEDGIEADDAIEGDELVPGAETTFEVTVEREETGTFDGEVTVETDTDVEEDLTTSVSGEAVAPEMNVTTDEVEFDETSVGSSSTETVTIENNGNTTLTVSEPEINSDHFSVVSGDREQRISASDSETITVGFAPSEEGEQATTLTLEPTNDPTDDETREIELSGEGTQADAVLNESSVSFGDVPQNETANEILQMTNEGTESVEITGSSSITGSDADAFNVTGLDEQTLGAGENQTFEVTLNATDEDRGSLSAGVEISTDEDDVTSSLGGTVVAPEIGVDSSLDAEAFGTTRLGDTSTARLQVNNTGNDELNVTDLSVDGDDDAAFSVVEAPEAIGSQDSERVTVEFDPANADEATNRSLGSAMDAETTLTIESDDPDSNETDVSLDGEAVTAALDVPRTERFGDVAVDETVSQEIEIENDPSATAPLNITDVAVGGDDAGAYDVEFDGEQTLERGESTTVDLNLTPSSTDRKFATVAVETNDTRQPVERIGVSNDETIYSVEYGSVSVDYSDPDAEGREPTVEVSDGFRDRNATLNSVNSNVTSDEDYSLSYNFGSNASEFNHTNLEIDPVDEENTTAFQYINATTTADDGDFEDSTFQTEVSKAAIAAQEADPENVTIYHENTSADDGYDRLETELLFETTKGYVYEVTTDSFSVFAVGATQPSQDEEEPDDDAPDDDSDDETNDDTATTGGSSSTTDDDVGETDDTDIENVVEEVEDTDPDVSVETEIQDSDPDREGISVQVEGTDSVRTITFADETVTGSVTVTEYGQPDAELTAQVEESMNTDLAAADAASTDDTDDRDGSTTTRLVSLTDITPSSEEAANSAATVELTVERDEIETPENALVVHETDDSWERLETSVEETTDEEVSLSAETDSFSLFAVAESEESTDTDETDSQQDDTDDVDEEGGTSMVLGLVGVVFTVVALVAVLAMRYRNS